MKLELWEIIEDMLNAGAVESGPRVYSITNSKGQLSRVGGPALAYIEEDESYRLYWYQNGMLHNPEGQAVFYSDKAAPFQYYLLGNCFTKEDWELKTCSSCLVNQQLDL
mgnify:CR=1 FL=1